MILSSKVWINVFLEDENDNGKFFLYGFYSGTGYPPRTKFIRIMDWPGVKKYTSTSAKANNGNPEGVYVWTCVLMAPNGEIFVSADTLYEEVG